jgi:glycosyltransferase involved in cell wall biosynthesis
MQDAGFGAELHYRGELDRVKKIEFLNSLDLLSVPCTYDEPKGIFLLEAMASGVPVVQPRRGAFPEILARTGGGILVEPERDVPTSLADAIYRLWKSPAERAELGRRGAEGVRAHYSVSQMAERALEAYGKIVAAVAHA